MKNTDGWFKRRWRSIKGISRYHWKPILGFTIAAIAFFFGSAVCLGAADSKIKNYWFTLAGCLTSISAGSLGILIAYVFHKDYLQSIQDYDSLEQVPIEQFIQGAHEIEVCVQGWDGLFWTKPAKAKITDFDPQKCHIKINDKWEDLGTKVLDTWRGRVWRSFFERGGKLTLILPIVPGETSDDRIKREFFVIHSRTGMTQIEQEYEIDKTLAAAQKTAQAAGKDSGSVIAVIRKTSLTWIFSMIFDNQWLLLSPYSKRYPGAKFRDPAFRIRLASYPNTHNWIRMCHDGDESGQP